MTGELAALTAALLWAAASILFAAVGQQIRAVNLNFFKGMIASAMMLVVLCTGSLLGLSKVNLSSLFSLTPEELIILSISGFIGIGAGDTAYFACLRRIGPQKGLMLESTAPILAAIQAYILYQETLSVTAWIGIMLTCTGVILVIKWSRSSAYYNTTLPGVLFGLLAAFCQASGIVLSRKVFLGGDVEPLSSGLIRITAALFIIGCWMMIRKVLKYRSADNQPMRDAVKIFIHEKVAARLFTAVILGTFLAIWLMQTSVKHTSAGITQTLLATCPLFGMLIGRFLGQKQSLWVWYGLALGVAGVGLLFLE